MTSTKCPLPHPDALTVLRLLYSNCCFRGRDIRRELNRGRWFWRRWSLPGFYGLMARVEDAGLAVPYWSRSPFVGLPLRAYWLTSRGAQVVAENAPEAANGGGA